MVFPEPCMGGVPGTLHGVRPRARQGKNAAGYSTLGLGLHLFGAVDKTRAGVRLEVVGLTGGSLASAGGSCGARPGAR